MPRGIPAFIGNIFSKKNYFYPHFSLANEIKLKYLSFVAPR